jgi:hypothetical protein
MSKAMDRLVRSRMYFLAKDPHWTFLWWELRAADAEHAQKRKIGVPKILCEKEGKDDCNRDDVTMSSQIKVVYG